MVFFSIPWYLQTFIKTKIVEFFFLNTNFNLCDFWRMSTSNGDLECHGSVDSLLECMLDQEEINTSDLFITSDEESSAPKNEKVDDEVKQENSTDTIQNNNTKEGEINEWHPLRRILSTFRNEFEISQSISFSIETNLNKKTIKQK